MELKAGQRLGPYEVLAPLGAGGMGEVYRARDSRLGREVALKVLPTALASNPERLARFEQEARSASALNHPGIVTVFEIGRDGEVAYLAMELVDGQTVRELLADGPLPLRRVLSAAAQIASGLAAAHDAGIVHRDLKPENVMMTRQGRVKILDFGLAKLFASETPGRRGSELPTAAHATEPGTVVGTVAYMSPEQVRGLPLDHRSDIFSLGALLYEMTSGVRPFGGATAADLMTAILKEDPAALSAATPPGLSRIVGRCLEKAPEERFQSARDLAFALEALSTASSTSVEAGPAPRATPASRRVMPLFLAAAGAFLLGWFLRPALSRSHAPSLSRAVRITSGPSQDFGSAISPDGKWVAYLSTARGPVDVWVKFLAGGEAVNLTEKSGLEVQRRTEIGGVDISPDGSLVAFDAGRPSSETQDFDSWVIAAPLGGTPRRLVEKGRGVRWSPDGRRIVYVQAGGGRGDALFVADADGGNPREVLKVRGGMHAHWCAWSSDGRFIYFIYGIAGSNREPTSIYRVSSAGGDPEPVVASSRRAVYPAPMPNGAGLLYAANPDTPDLTLWWRSLGGGAPVRLTRGVGEYAEPRVSSDGRSVVATLIESREALMRIPVRFDSPVSPEPATTGFLGDFDPAMSPRGDRLVWSSSRSGNRNLWISNPDGSNARPLSTGIAFDERPAFSPDGKTVAFVSDRGGERAIWLVSSDGGAPRKLASALVLDSLTWSPGGDEIVFAAPAGDLPGLFRLGVAGGKISRLPIPAGGFSPAWRPGSAEIAYLAVDPPRIAALVKFVDSSGKPLHTDRADSPAMGVGTLAWTADGRRLMAAEQRGGEDGIIFVAESDGGLRRLATLPVSHRMRGATWSPDGNSILFGQYEPSSDIVLFNLD